MKFAYADPPYLGCCGLYGHRHQDWGCWDSPTTHEVLIGVLRERYPDGWALSASSPSLRVILPFCPDDVRVGVWVKPFASFKPSVNPAYAWEPVIWRGGRKLGRDVDTVRDWVSENITLQRGLTGAKPLGFSCWLFDILGADPAEDTLDDIFPGTGAVSAAWDAYCNGGRVQGPLFPEITP